MIGLLKGELGRKNGKCGALTTKTYRYLIYGNNINKNVQKVQNVLNKARS